MTDKRIEQSIFATKSDDGTGPKLHYQAVEYRIEGYYHGRPISIWEMRNPFIYLEYAKMICDFNFSKVAQEKIEAIKPKDKNDLFAHQVINDWGPKLQGFIKDVKSALSAKGD